MTLIDTTGALERFDNDREIYLSLVETFLELPPPDFDGMKANLEAGHTADTIHAVHQLKGAALTLGADTLAHSAAALEALLRGNTGADPFPLLAEISGYYFGTVKELELVRSDLQTHQ